MTQIIDYNQTLVTLKTNISIIDYVKNINKLIFNIDISFIDEFIELVSKDDCCIHHNMLQKYEVLTLKGTTNDVKRLFEQYEFEQYFDFELRKVAQLRPQGGKSNKTEYFLHPRAFKICLMRSLKTKKICKILFIIRRMY